jgi:hypothetical protein
MSIDNREGAMLSDPEYDARFPWMHRDPLKAAGPSARECEYCGSVIDGFVCPNCGGTKRVMLSPTRESNECRFLRYQMENATSFEESHKWGLLHEAARKRERG